MHTRSIYPVFFPSLALDIFTLFVVPNSLPRLRDIWFGILHAQFQISSWFSPVTGQVGDERGRDIEPTCNVTTCADPDANAPRGSYLFNLKNDPYEEVSLG